jgi:flagellar basal-body rod modification protein FlgD
MSTTPVTSSGSGSAAAATATLPTSAATISTQDFMQLLSTEMANQDPLQPMDPTQSLTQLAQFSTLQQTSQLSQNQSMATANSLIGAQVTFPGVNGAAGVSGVVTAIDDSAVAQGGMPQLVVAGASQEYSITSLAQVTLPSTTGGSSSSTGSTTGSTSGSTTTPAATTPGS